ncbi:sigma-70 family RNA polymerase sigma factor [bacterium]|nr:sigma-70 family RNA polymerase sigma factor [bacterium]
MLKRISRKKSKHASRSQSGAFRDLFLQEETLLLRFGCALVGRRAVAEEIVQEVFLQLHLQWSEVEFPRAWLYRSVRNRCLNHLRNERCVDAQRAEAILEHAEVTHDSPEDSFTKLEMIQMVKGLMESLPDVDRELLRMKYFDGLRYREISERTGMSVSNVGYRLHFLLKRLADQLHTVGMD